MTVVLDSSITLAWCFEDERTPGIIAIFEEAARYGAFAPPLWRYEISNGLLMAQRRKRIGEELRKTLLLELAGLDVELDEEADKRALSATAELANRFGLTVYDAAYLELAQRRALPLATLDQALARAAAAAGVEVLG